MSTELTELVAMLRTLDKSATPGPWDNDYFYSMGGVFKTPNKLGVPIGQCSMCSSPEQEPVKLFKTYHIHRRRYVEDDCYDGWHKIHNARGVTVAGNFDYEDGGIINREDAALIVAIRNALPTLLDALDPPKRRRASLARPSEDDGE